MRQVTSFLKGALLGAVLGAAAGLLIAPTSGEELKSRAVRKMRGFRSELEHAYESRKAQLEAELARMRDS